MIYIATLIWLFWSIIISFVIYYIWIINNIQIQSFSIFVVFPIASMIIWFSSWFLFAVCIKFLQIKPSFKTILIWWLIWVFSWFSIYYLDYITLAFNNNEIIYSFSNEYTHIKEQITFFDYLNLLVSNTESSFFIKWHMIEWVKNQSFSTISYLIEFIWYILWWLAALGLIINNSYCNKCKNYYKNWKVYEIWLSVSDNIIQIYNDIIKNNKEIDTLFNKDKIEFDSNNERVKLQFSEEKCPKCFEWFFYIKFFEYDNKENKFIELSKLGAKFKIINNKINVWEVIPTEILTLLTKKYY